MPFSLRESGNTEYSTQATMTLVNLATDIADPAQRLRAIRDAAGAIKSVDEPREVGDSDRYAVGRCTLAAGWAGCALRTIEGRGPRFRQS